MIPNCFGEAPGVITFICILGAKRSVNLAFYSARCGRQETHDFCNTGRGNKQTRSNHRSDRCALGNMMFWRPSGPTHKDFHSQKNCSYLIGGCVRLHENQKQINMGFAPCRLWVLTIFTISSFVGTLVASPFQASVPRTELGSVGLHGFAFGGIAPHI